MGHAADKPQVSSRDDLARCLAESDKLEDERASLETAMRRLESAQKDLQTLSRIHSANRPKVSLRDKASVDAFNQKTKLLQSLSTDLNEQSTDLLARQNEFNAKIDASNQRCAGMVVMLDDQEALLLERIKQRATK